MGRSTSDLEFDELDAFRKDLIVMRNLQPVALAWFRDEPTNGFKSSRQRDGGRLSPSSTATCVVSLIASSQWKDGIWAERETELARRLLLETPTTRGLEKGNIYTEAFIYEAILALAHDEARHGMEAKCAFVEVLEEELAKQRLLELNEKLLESIDDGWAAIGDYPPSAYMTQLVVRVLKKSLPIERNTDVFYRVSSWAWNELYRQLALGNSNLKSADSFQLAYTVTLIATLEEPGKASPDDRRLLDTALDQIFGTQLEDGTWPRSAPIFDLPGQGSSYCYEYEMLTQLLLERNLEERLLRYLPQLRKAYDALITASYELPSGALAWASGHRPQGLGGPESWATASGYHFIHALERLVAEAIRRAVFRYLRAPYKRPGATPARDQNFAPRLLDSTTSVAGEEVSLRSVLLSSFVRPIADQAARLESGKALPSAIPTTAIFFGPPGTSKTELSVAISDYLQWPRIALDPSHFVRSGMDMLSAEADRLFAMLESLDRVVVLLDEIDELVRERSGSTEILSRFLTTSMLPKLAAIRRAKRTVFIVATNHIEQFDIAISRPGRFDLILQVMPPTLNEKYVRWPVLRDKLADWLADDQQRESGLAQLTYDEASRLAERLEGLTSRAAVRELDRELQFSTLNTPIDRADTNSRTWAQVCEEQRPRNRVPRMTPVKASAITLPSKQEKAPSPKAGLPEGT